MPLWGSATAGFANAGPSASYPGPQTYGKFPTMQNPFSASLPTAGPTSAYPQAQGPQVSYGSTWRSPQQGGPTSAYPQGSGGGGGNGGMGGALGAAASALPTLGAMAAGAGTGLTGMGKASMTGQIALNTYQYQSQLGMNGGNYTGNQRALAQQAYGTAGGGGQAQMSNNWGTSPQDLAQAYAIMGAQAGNPMLNQTSLGRNLLGGTSSFSYLNPAMSGTQSAMAMQQLYSPQQSLAERQLGYGTTPLTMGKPGANGMGKWVASQMTGWGVRAGNTPTPSQMAAELGPNGMYAQNLQAEGLNPSNYASTFEAYNRLFQGYGKNGAGTNKKLGYPQAQALLGGLGSKNVNMQKQAEKELQSYGIDQTDLNRLKNVSGSQAAQQGDTSQGFTAGLQAATRTLTAFNTGLGKLMNSLGINKALGAGQGAMGTIGSFGGIGAVGGGLFGSILGGVTNLIGGGAATPVTAPSGKGSSATSKGTSASTSMSTISKQAQTAVHAAEGEIGVPYVWGGTTPKGFDCSGLVQWAYKQAGVNIPRTSEAQWAALKNRAIPNNKAEEGDLVFMAGSGDGGTPNNPGHVGMMVSGNKLIQAPYPGKNVEIIGYSPGEWSHVARVSGSLLGGGGTTSGTGGTTTTTTSSGAAGGGFMGAAMVGGGQGDSSNEGSTSELSAYESAIMGGISAGSGYTGTTSTSSTTTPSSGGTPSGATPVPTAPGGPGLAGYMSAVLKGIGAPATAANMSTMNIWSTRDEGFRWPGGPNAGGHFNPLNSTQPAANTTNYNSDGVKNYPTEAEGIGATIATLKNGFYPGIISGLKAGKGLSGTGPWNSELLKWSGNGYSTIPAKARGGSVPAGQVSLVGERGPELITAGGQGADVISSRQSARLMHSSVADGPYKNSVSSGLNTSPANAAFSGMTGGGKNGNGTVNLNFGASSINITMPTGSGSPINTGSAARNMASQFVEQLSKMDLYSAIANGTNS